MNRIKNILKHITVNIRKINKLSLPATILIASIIFGGFFYASQVYKQQLQKEADQANEKVIAKNTSELFYCLGKAESDYQSSVELNGTTNENGNIEISNYVRDVADKEKQKAIDNCYKQYEELNKYRETSPYPQGYIPISGLDEFHSSSTK